SSDLVSNISTVVGSASGADTVTGASQTWTLDGANSGHTATYTWSSFENLTDTGTGTFNMHGTGNGSITGNLNGGTGGTMSYAGYTSAVTFGLAGAANTSTGITGTRTGITSVTGASLAGDSITGTAQTYNLDNAITDKGNNGTISWTSFANLADTGAGTFNMGTGGSVSGDISATGGRLNYGSYSTPVAIDFTGGGTATGIGGNWSGITTGTGRAGNDAVV